MSRTVLTNVIDYAIMTLSINHKYKGGKEMKGKTITLDVPEGFSQKELDSLVKAVEREKKRTERKEIPYIGYSCGKNWLVAGVRYEDAKANAVDKFMEEFGDVLPQGINKSIISPVIGVRKLGPEWTLPVDSTIEFLVTAHNSKPRRKK